MIAATTASDLVQAASLLVAALAFVYSLWYPELVAARDKEMSAQESDRGGERKEILGVLLRRALPLLVTAAIVTLIFVPPVIDVVEHARDRLRDDGWNAAWADYDAIQASLVVLVVAGAALTLHVLWMAIRIEAHRREKGEPPPVAQPSK